MVTAISGSLLFFLLGMSNIAPMAKQTAAALGGVI